MAGAVADARVSAGWGELPAAGVPWRRSDGPDCQPEAAGDGARHTVSWRLTVGCSWLLFGVCLFGLF